MPAVLRKIRIAGTVAVAMGAVPMSIAAWAQIVPSEPEAAGVVSSSPSATDSASFAPIVSADKPAVVTVEAKVVGQSDESDTISPFEGGPFDEQFKQFFGGQDAAPKNPQPAQPNEEDSLGSGFVVSPDGIIVTNNHVVDGATDIKVTLDDGTELGARLVGADAKSDIAVLKVESPTALKALKWGDSDSLKVGDRILAIGDPFGIGMTVTAGIVSARGRDLHSGPYDDFIQIDAPINRGNSGGPLVGSDGKVVGINTAIYSPNGGSVGVGFAIPSNEARGVVEKLVKDGAIVHGYIGVVVQPVTDDAAEAIGISKAEGALVADVKSDGPAAAAGVLAGDVITAFGGQPVASPRSLSRAVADMPPNSRETITVWRRGDSKNFAVTVGDDQPKRQAASVETKGRPDVSAKRLPTIGARLGDITPAIRRGLHLPQGEIGAVVEGIVAGKPAADAGLQPGDIIRSVNQLPVGSAKAVRAAIANALAAGHRSVLLLVQRQYTQSLVTMALSD